MDALQKNRIAFGAQSKGFSSAGDTYADEAGLAWMLQDLPMFPTAEALDIATGTGEFARALSPHVARVVGLDATEAMIEQGRSFIARAGLENVEFQSGLVEALPFEDERFDIVSSRYAFHHFADPKPVMAEMVRVCRTGGYVIIVDIVVPETSNGAAYNFYEWLCDPSHTRCLEADEFRTYCGLAGLQVVSARTRNLEEELIEWMDFSLTATKHREKILEAVKAELDGGRRTGLSPYERGSTLCFTQRDLAIVGRKLASPG
jgi:ubiquinone/menaquinone biosynthesis C-methylase UbiE